MSDPVLLALALPLSVAVAALGLALGGAVERLGADPVLRGRVWTGVMAAAVLPPLFVGLALAAPAPAPSTPAIQAAPPVLEGMATPILTSVAAPVSPDWSGLIEAGAWAVLAFASLLALLRLAALALRARRLAQLTTASVAADPALTARVEAAAARLGVAAPPVRLSPTGEAMLAGLRRPLLILPDALAGSDAQADAVIAHELGHLKRRDHLALWLEEAVGAILAINPMLAPIRRRAAAAREEACDALALADADVSARRAYARLLIAAMRDHRATPLPALTFTGHARTFAMNRLNAVLNPAPAAGRRPRILALALGSGLALLAGGGSLAVAAQREAVPEQARHSDWQWIAGALTPVYRSAWPGACGFGRSASEGGLFIHLGEGCTGAGVANPRPVGIEGVDLKARPRQAFERVRDACAAGRPVSVVYREGDRRRTAQAVCDKATVDEFAALAPGGPLSLLTFPAAVETTETPRVVPIDAARFLLNGRPLPAGLPAWALAPERIDIRTTEDGGVDFILPFSGSTPVSVNGRRMPEGFPVRGIAPEAVARVDIDGDHVRYVLRSEAETRAARGAVDAARTAADAAATSPRTASEPADAAAIREAYSALLTVRENGRTLATTRLRVRPDGDASAVLNTDGRDYQFDLYLEGPDWDPEDKGRLTLRADVARTGEAGGWVPLVQPRMLFAPDGQARMLWSGDGQLEIEITVEPA